ncbi:MAG: OsmC family protein [Candidatus Baldrarchaeia archaeon]
MEKISFKAEVRWTQGTRGKIHIKNFEPIEIGIIKEFGGEEILGPEDLFIASVASCVLTTFLYFAKKYDVEYNKIVVDANGTIRRMEGGYYKFTKIDVKLKVAASEEAKFDIEECFNFTKKYCIISNTIKDCVTLNLALEFLE